MRTGTSSDSTLGRRAIDGLLEVYVSWREECGSVREAYQSWADSDRGQRRLAYAGYIAALDREEHAARAYADQVERVSRIHL
jgi:hypothetical protein